MQGRKSTQAAAVPTLGHGENKEASSPRLKHRLVEFWNTQPLYWDGITDDSPHRERAASFIPQGSCILDVACGSAANAIWLTRRGTYFGADISQLGLRRAQHKNLQLICADAEKLPFAHSSFDAVISTYALEHCVHPARVLREMSRVVRPNGRIVLLGPSWDLPFWYPNALQSCAGTPGWRRSYTWKRLLGQLRGWLLGRLPFFIIEDPDALRLPFVYDADAVYVVWSYEVIQVMKSWGLRLVHCDVDDRMLGTHAAVRLFKRLLYRLPPYRYAGSTILMVFER